MHMDNPLAFANLIINDLLGLDLPVELPTVEEVDVQKEVMGTIADLADENGPNTETEE